MVGSALAKGHLGTGEAVATDEQKGEGLVRVGSKTFTEQYILADLIARQFEDVGFEVEKVEGLGSAVVFEALRKGDIDCYVDYTGTIWANHMSRKDTPAAGEALTLMSGWLESEHGVSCMGPLGFENAYALVMRRALAAKRGVRSIADLANQASGMKLGSDFEFFSRPEWYTLRDTYHLKFDDLVSMDSTFMYDAVATGEVDVITAFSSDGRIAGNDLVALTDPRGAFPPYDAVLLVRKETLLRPGVIRALRPLIDAISVELMREANLRVDRSEDKKTVSETAEWLRDQIR